MSSGTSSYIFFKKIFLVCVNRSFTAHKIVCDSLAGNMARIVFFMKAWKSQSFM